MYLTKSELQFLREKKGRTKYDIKRLKMLYEKPKVITESTRKARVDIFGFGTPDAKLPWN